MVHLVLYLYDYKTKYISKKVYFTNVPPKRILPPRIHPHVSSSQTTSGIFLFLPSSTKPNGSTTMVRTESTRPLTYPFRQGTNAESRRQGIPSSSEHFFLASVSGVRRQESREDRLGMTTDCSSSRRRRRRPCLLLPLRGLLPLALLLLLWLVVAAPTTTTAAFAFAFGPTTTTAPLRNRVLFASEIQQVDPNDLPTTSAAAIAQEVQSTPPRSTLRQEEGKPQLQPPSPHGTRKTVGVVICPAQFCVPADYDALIQELPRLVAEQSADNNDDDDKADPNSSASSLSSSMRIGHVTVAPLPRTEWIKVARQLPTSQFWTSELSVPDTLSWYFDAIDTAVAEVVAAQAAEGAGGNNNDWSLCLVGHSIGGWVARAYLGGMAQSSTAAHQWALQRSTSLITLGTPHAATEHVPAWLDQTRGLLKAVGSHPACTAQALTDRGIDVTCVASRAISAIPSTNVEELVALASYPALLGSSFQIGALGDGVVPLEGALMDRPARHLIVDHCPQTGSAIRHAHVIPTPWNLWDGAAPSLSLEKLQVAAADQNKNTNGGFASYLSPGVVKLWAKHVR